MTGGESRPPERQRRDSARVIVLDQVGRVLLFCVVDPRSADRPIWMTPGGRIELNETARETAVRELHEETGLHVHPDELVGPIARSSGDWEFRGVAYEGEDVFFVLRTSHFSVDDANWSDLERELHQSWRWCGVEALEHLEGAVLPLRLAELITDVLAGKQFGAPIVLPWSAG